MGIIAWLIIGIIVGYVAGGIVGYDRTFTMTGGFVLGILGAVVGGFILDLFLRGDYVMGLNIATLVTAAIGASLAIVIWNTLGRIPKDGHRAG